MTILPLSFQAYGNSSNMIDLYQRAITILTVNSGYLFAIDDRGVTENGRPYKIVSVNEKKDRPLSVAVMMEDGDVYHLRYAFSGQEIPDSVPNGLWLLRPGVKIYDSTGYDPKEVENFYNTTFASDK